MKLKSASPILAACIICFLTCSGCLDITTTTQVNHDGSLVRTITFKGDSTDVYAGKFPVDLDSTWTRAITKVKGKDRDYMLTASRAFHDFEEMNVALHGTFGQTLQYNFGLQKSFQWFFTVYRYQETTLPYEQFTTIPISNFLSKAEIEWAKITLMDVDPKKLNLTRGDSLALESITPRLEEYERQNHFAPVFEAFLEGVKTINSPLLTTSTVEQMKDSLYRSSEKQLEEIKIDTLQFVFAHVLRSPVAKKAWQANAPAFAEVKRRLEFEGETNSNSYVTSVVMPGLITGSNATKIEGNIATWQDFKEHADRFGFTMWVESRQVNWWAVVVAFVIVGVLVILLILSLARSRRRI